MTSACPSGSESIGWPYFQDRHDAVIDEFLRDLHADARIPRLIHRIEFEANFSSTQPDAPQTGFPEGEPDAIPEVLANRRAHAGQRGWHANASISSRASPAAACCNLIVPAKHPDAKAGDSVGEVTGS